MPYKTLTLDLTAINLRTKINSRIICKKKKTYGNGSATAVLVSTWLRISEKQNYEIYSCTGVRGVFTKDLLLKTASMQTCFHTAGSDTIFVQIYMQGRHRRGARAQAR